MDKGKDKEKPEKDEPVSLKQKIFIPFTVKKDFEVEQNEGELVRF